MSGKQRELAVITAHIYRPGDVANFEDMLNAETDLWHFSDPEASCIWDVLVDEDARPDVTFASYAVHVTFEHVTNTQRWITDEYKSFLHEGAADDVANILNADLIFGVVELHISAVEAEERRHNYVTDELVEVVKLFGLFDVELHPRLDEFGMQESYTPQATFLGELDLTRLKVKATWLEVLMLRVLRDAGEIGLTAGGIGAALINKPDFTVDECVEAMNALERDQLIEERETTGGFPRERYVLTEYGQKVLHDHP